MSLNLNDETETIIASVVAIVAADNLDAQARHEKLAEISTAVDEAMFDLEAQHGIDPLDNFEDDEDDEDEYLYNDEDDEDFDDDFDDDEDEFGFDEDDEDDEFDEFGDEDDDEEE